ncbi:hypothetical protein F5B20DRAFT_526365 [Whalleya microplaca]|nr:hypothetical protein F5B20DRAFT_526365 [Whalleya microplaca]
MSTTTCINGGSLPLATYGGGYGAPPSSLYPYSGQSLNNTTYHRLRNSRHQHNQHSIDVFSNMGKSDKVSAYTGQTLQTGQQSLSPELPRSRSPANSVISFFRRRSSASLQPSDTGASSAAPPPQSSSSAFSSLRRSLSNLSIKSEDSAEKRQSRNPFLGSNLSPGLDSQRPPTPPPTYLDSVVSGPSGASGSSHRTPFHRSAAPSVSSSSAVVDNDFSFLREFDTILLIDDSGSMALNNCWQETKLAVSAILPECIKHDTDGIDLYFINHQTKDQGDISRGVAGTGYLCVKEKERVEKIFREVQPTKDTMTAKRLGAILRPYLNNYEDKLRETRNVECVRPINIIVITDGAPTDEPEGIIVETARRLDEMRAPAHQVGIQFFQVGTDPRAKRALNDLDNELSKRYQIRDMVDTCTFDSRSGWSGPTLTAEGILKVVLGGVKRKLDRQPVGRPPAISVNDAPY